MKKRNLFSKITMSLVFMIFTIIPAHADILEVIPTTHDFGDVEIGTTTSTIVTLTNVNGSDIEVNNIEFQAGSSVNFTLVNPPATPFYVVPGETKDIQVVFTPSATGYFFAELKIESTDWSNPLQTVSLTGTGVDVQPPPISIQDILAFFDASVANGTIVGDGPGKSAVHKLDVFRNMLVNTSKFLDAGNLEGGCTMLNNAYRRCDGQRNPSDFVIGSDLAELNTMILELFIVLDCDLKLKKGSLDDDFIKESIHHQILLKHNYPNPFYSETTITYSLPEDAHVNLTVYNIFGKVIDVLVDEYKTSGSHRVVWEASDQTGGMYIYKLEANGYVISKEMILIR